MVTSRSAWNRFLKQIKLMCGQSVATSLPKKAYSYKAYLKPNKHSYKEIYFCMFAPKHCTRQSLSKFDIKDFSYPVFLDKNRAQKYGRFLATRFCILKAYVKEDAIESGSEQFSLRAGSLQRELIHGFYDALSNDAFIINPHFNLALMFGTTA